MPNASTILRNESLSVSVPAKKADASVYTTASASSQCAPEICRRGRSATGGARIRTATIAPANSSRSGDSAPGTPSCSQFPARGVRKMAALSV